MFEHANARRGGSCGNTVVVRRVLLAGEELLGVVHAAVDAHADLVHDGGLKVDEDRAGHVLAGRGLREEGVERVVLAADGLVGRHLPVRLDAVLEAVKLRGEGGEQFNCIT